MGDPRILKKAEDVSDHMLVLTVSCVEDWFPPGASEGMSTEDFIDILCEDYLNTEGWDIESLDTPAVRKIMKHARRVRADLI
jgi:hypothetical protein